jgi:ribosomal protein S18 acetylase RimI-like enzyme
MNTTLACTLRAATPADAEFELQLYASTRSDLLPLGPEVFEGLVGMQFRAQTMSINIEHPQADHQILAIADDPVGRLIVDASGECVHIIDIALLTEHRGNGIGSTVLAQVIADASRSQRSMRLHVERNSPAARLFERLGFSTEGDTGLYRSMIRP